MRCPKSPPPLSKCLAEEVNSNPEFLFKLLRDEVTRAAIEEANNHGWNWEECSYRSHRVGLTPNQFWALVKLSRANDRKSIPLRDKDGSEFTYRLPPAAHRILHLIDINLGGTIGTVFPQIATDDDRMQYLLTSLREEAISSSLIEGAVVTRNVAKEMLRESRRPRTKDEQMIVNNYRTIRMLNERRKEPMTPELLCEVQRSLTEGTLDHSDAAGRFRIPSEQITVWDEEEQEPLFVPPPAEQLHDRIAKLCEFANRAIQPSDKGDFIHPAIRGIALHFWLAYDHPFVDGNGRTARALFYWSMLRDNYWLAEYLTISTVIYDQPKQYARAYLDTEQDDRDLTYFILFHLNVIEKSILAFREYLDRKVRQQREQILVFSGPFNSRQRSLLIRAQKDPTTRFTFESHAGSHGVSIPTARSDLLELRRLGLLRLNKQGRRFEFLAAADLQTRLAALRQKR